MQKIGKNKYKKSLQTIRLQRFSFLLVVLEVILLLQM